MSIDCPMVSICCLTYNHATFLRDALDSFLRQKTDFSYEILIHDDASTDGTQEILRSYEREYPSIVHVFYEATNQYGKGTYPGGYFHGCLAAQAHGKYIALCEGDDYWCDENKLQDQVNYLERHPETVSVCHAAKVIDGQSGESLGLMGMGDVSRVLTASEVITKWNIPTASRVYRRSINDEYVRNWDFEKPVGDFPAAVFELTKGDMYYDAKPMSVYRYRAPGSWTSSMLDWDKLEQAELCWQKMLGHIDSITNHRFHDSLLICGDSHINSPLIQSGRNSIRIEFAKEVIGHLSIKKRVLISLCRILWLAGFAVQVVGYGDTARYKVTARG